MGVFKTQSKVENYILENNMIGGATKVYVATSGGADSMALLATLVEFRNELGIEVGAVHVNHGIRGETARRDANFVKDYCSSYDIEFVLFDAEQDGVKVPENASEDWARQLRYNYFSKLINRTTKVATAHTLSDQAETVIFRMTRGGSGLNGLSGIPPVRGNYIRPFLCITRQEVEELVEYYGTGNVTDETNLGDDYSRNKIRHNVIPVLKGINPSFERSIGKICERMEKAQKFINGQAKAKLAEAEVIRDHKYDIKDFVNADEIILDEMVSQLLLNLGIQTEQNITDVVSLVNKRKNARGTSNDLIIGSLSNRYKVYISSEYITLVNMKVKKEKIPEVGVNVFGDFGYNVVIEEVSAQEYIRDTADKHRMCLYTSETAVDLGKLTIKQIKSGDKFKPACKTGGSITKFMRAIPLAERTEVPVLESDGEIIWVWGQGFTDNFIPSHSDLDTNRKIYRITWQ